MILKKFNSLFPPVTLLPTKTGKEFYKEFRRLTITVADCCEAQMLS